MTALNGPGQPPSAAGGTRLPLVSPETADPLGAAPVVLLTSQTCTACFKALPVVAEIAAEFGVEAREAQVESWPQLAKEHGPQIPVLVIDGVPRDFWVIDPSRFRRILSER